MAECDFPGCGKRGRGVGEYVIEVVGGILRVDLCKEHSRPLYDFVAALPSHKFTKTVGRSRSRPTTMAETSWEEIKAAKSKGS